VPLTSAVSALGATCSEGLTNLVVTLGDELASSVRVARVTCGSSVHFADLAPGALTVNLTADRAGAELSAACSATVEPGLVAELECATAP
jgi:hypothetical protein